MAVTYVNRQSKTYYLHAAKTKKGNPKYYFALASEGTLVDQLPAGFEIYEHPTGQVTLRRARPRLVTDDELQLVSDALARVKAARWSYAERDLKTITVYVGHNGEALEDMFRYNKPLITQAELDKSISQFVNYSAVFRFVLIDSGMRVFRAQRYCYLGSIDDWVFIGRPDVLSELVRQYLPHIEQNSYYELT